ncbi:MAG: restriction endonuclease [bacterium]|nr:restriction endonuclease [bacterium]
MPGKSHVPRGIKLGSRSCQHFPVAILVSCKRWSRKLHQGDIDAFAGELASSSAHKGVIYSYSGFTGPAQEKAAKLGISCCRLYQNEPPDLPKQLVFDVHLCSQRVMFSLYGYVAAEWRFETWGDVLDLPDTSDGEGEKRVADMLQTAFHEAEQQAVRDLVDKRLWPPDAFGAAVGVGSPEGEARSPFRIGVQAEWKWYRARLEAYELDGS